MYALNMSLRDPFPSPKLENDFTLRGFRPEQRKKSEKPTHITQTEEPWCRLHDTGTLASTRRSVMHQEHQAPKDNLDFQLATVYDHHRDFFQTKNQLFYQRETFSMAKREQEKQEMLEKEQEEDIRMWVDPQKRSIHSIK